MLNSAIVATLLAIAIVAVVITLKKKRNEKYFYRFYTDKFIYHDTFFKNKNKEANYQDFKEIRYNQSFWQSKFNLGEIYILTNNKNIFKRIITIKAVPDVEKNYEEIVKLFNT